MVTKCANPSCATEFRYFRGGKLFHVAPNSGPMTHDADFQGHGHVIEVFWLCEACASTTTIVPGNFRKSANDGKEHLRWHPQLIRPYPAAVD
jgi:hypothetical protein